MSPGKTALCVQNSHVSRVVAFDLEFGFRPVQKLLSLWARAAPGESFKCFLRVWAGSLLYAAAGCKWIGAEITTNARRNSNKYFSQHPVKFLLNHFAYIECVEINFGPGSLEINQRRICGALPLFWRRMSYTLTPASHALAASREKILADAASMREKVHRAWTPLAVALTSFIM